MPDGKEAKSAVRHQNNRDRWSQKGALVNTNRTRCLALILCLFTLVPWIPAASAAEAAGDQTAAERMEEEPSTDPPPSDEEDPEASATDIMPLADTVYDFTTLLSSSDTSDPNCYLTYQGGSGTRAVSVHQVKTGGKTYWAYCADNRKDWPGSYSDFTQTALPSSGFYQVQKVVMALGFGDNNTARLKELFGYTLNNYEAYQATQIVLWAAQVWEQQWNYLGPAPATIREGVEDYWSVKTPSGKSANARNFALALADAAQAVYEDNFSCQLSITQESTSTSAVRYKLTVQAVNYFGGYTGQLSGLPSGCTLTSSGSNVTVSSATAFSSKTATGTDTLYLTVPKGTKAQNLTLSLSITPYVRQYSSNSALNFLTPASSSYQTILCSGGTLSAPSVFQSVKVTLPRLPTGQITLTKLDAETRQPAPGVVFALYQYNGTDYVDTGSRATSDSKGKATFSNLQYTTANQGLYRVFEVSSEDYEVWTSPYVCWVSLASGQWYSYETADGTRKSGKATPNSSGSYDFTFAFTAYNQPKVQYGSLTLRKQDGDGEPLAQVAFVLSDSKGSALTFSKASDGSYQPDSKGLVLLTTDSKGTLTVKQLEYGTYLVSEVETAEGGYTLLPTSFSVTLPTEDSADLTYTVVNRSDFQLPATGGTGTWGLTVLSLFVPLTLLYYIRKEFLEP